MKTYEVKFTKTQLNLNGDSVYSRTNLYQVVADSEIMAVFQLGQVFNRQLDYEIKIESIKVVGK